MMKSHFVGLVVVVVAAILVTGCSPTPSNDGFSDTTATSLASPDATVQIPTQIQASLTATVDPETGLSKQCLTRTESLPKDVSADGILILSQESKLYSLDLATMLKTSILQPGHQVSDISVNPNRTAYYYMDSNTSRSNVITNSENVSITFPYRDEWRIGAYLDNNRLIFTHSNEPYNALRIVDPIDGSETQITLDVQNAYYFMSSLSDPVFIVTVDPSLSRVIYFDTEGIGRVVLWDIQKENILATLPYIVPKDPTDILDVVPFFPGWSPDGNQFIIGAPVKFSDDKKSVLAEELFSVSHNGKVQQLTNLSSIYQHVHVSQVQWSPDGQHVAFWLQISNDKTLDQAKIPERLVVLNTQTMELADLCLTPDSPWGAGSVLSPVWSPNSKQLMVETYSSSGERIANLIDIRSHLVVSAANGYTPLGWIVAP